MRDPIAGPANAVQPARDVRSRALPPGEGRESGAEQSRPELLFVIRTKKTGPEPEAELGYQTIRLCQLSLALQLRLRFRDVSLRRKSQPVGANVVPHRGPVMPRDDSVQ